MRRVPTPLFRLTLLQLALASGFVHAADSGTQLETIHVKGEGVSATQRITTKSIDETTDTDLKAVLSSEPAISFGGGNGTSQWYTIRGMGQDQIDIRVDDTYSDSQMFHHNGRFMLDPSLVKVIGVQKGTGSASAGIGATSGAIIAETVEARDLLREGQQAGFKVDAGVSSNKGWWRGATAYGQAGGFDGLVSGNWVTERDYKDGHDTRVAHSGIGQRGLLAKAGYRFNEDNRIELSHRQERFYGERNLREEFDFAQVGNDARNDPRYRITTQDTTNLEYKGGGFGFVDKIKANVYRQQTQREEPSSDSNPTNKILTYGANLGLDSRLFEKHTLKYGINWRNQELKPASRTNRFGVTADTVNERKTDIGAYAEGIWDIEPVTLTTGLRYDYFKMRTSSGKEGSHGSWNPSIGAIYDITPNLALNASLNWATRSPRMQEAALSGGTLISIDDNVKPERSRNAEIGLKYNWNQALSLNASYFHQTIHDLQNFEDRNGVSTLYNSGTLKNNGYELGAAYRWRGLTARLGVAYSKPKLDGTTYDSVVTSVPIGRTWTTGLAYQFDNPNLEIGWKARFVQSTIYDTASNNRGAGGTGVTRPGYGVNDFYANWKPTGKDNLNINLAVNNAFDKYYKSHSQRSSASNGSSLPETGRDIRLGVNYRF